MSFSRHLRRHAHRVAKKPRSGWRRAYSYTIGHTAARPGMPLYIPMSEDAPFDEEDAQFWDWVATVLIGGVLVGLVLWGIISLL